VPSTTGAAARNLPPLTRESVVDAAAEIVAAEGYQALSMRRLAAKCGVAPMTLYAYVGNKDELLQALMNRVLAADEFGLDPSDPWQRQVAESFRSVRARLLEHTELLPVAATQRIEGAAAYRGAESLFGALRKGGLSDKHIVQAFDALVSYTVGFTQREAGLLQSDTAALPGLRQLPRDEFPNVLALAGILMTRDMEENFNAGLELLIAGIATWATE
jgi:TetR/AcrR family transcriptional regulator, tetracycline repressor protein